MRTGLHLAFSLTFCFAALPAQHHAPAPHGEAKPSTAAPPQLPTPPLATSPRSGSVLAAQRTPEEALQALEAGNQRFRSDRSVPQPLGEGTRRTLARGQSPLAVVLCCADSRTAPEHLFNTGLGELVVVRTPGHVLDAEAIATIEHAVETYDVPLCVVLGHEQCATVAQALALAQADQAGKPIPALSQLQRSLLESIEPAARKVAARDLGGADLLVAGEEEHAQATALECLRRSPLLRRYQKAGRFRITAARYHLQSGQVEWLPQRPLPLDDAVAAAVRSVAPMSMPPHVALRLLQAGNRRFLSEGPQTANLGTERREQLTHGQQPYAVVLCCADSRVVPEHLFDAGLGELVVLRSSAAVLTDVVLAGMEKAIAETGASLVVVLGHNRCDAFAAALAGSHAHGAGLSAHQRALQQRLEPALAEARSGAGAAGGSEVADRAAVVFTKRTVAAVRARSALLVGLEQAGKLAVLPCFYDVATGDVQWLKDGVGEEAMAAPAPGGESAGRAGSGHADSGHGTAPAKQAGSDGHGAGDHGSAGHGEHQAGGHGAAGHGEPGHGAAGAGHGGNPFDALLLGDEPGHAGAGKAGHGSADGHGTHGEGAAKGSEHGGGAGHGSDGHGQGGGHEAAGTGHEHGDSGHGTDGHGSSGHAADGHGADVHGHDDGHGAKGAAKAHSPWLDPVVLVGLLGVGSLLLAAGIALGRR
jgi:carbonic anhydrase